MKTRKIKQKDLDILSKWARGAIARRKFVKLVETTRIKSKFKFMFLIYIF